MQALYGSRKALLRRILLYVVDLIGESDSGIGAEHCLIDIMGAVPVLYELQVIGFKDGESGNTANLALPEAQAGACLVCLYELVLIEENTIEVWIYDHPPATARDILFYQCFTAVCHQLIDVVGVACRVVGQLR